MKTTLILSLVSLLLAGNYGLAAVRRVPADYATIQEAIDASVDGDVVLVAPGTYTGDGNRDIDFKGKTITVRSQEGPKTCTIDCQGKYYLDWEGLHEEYHRGFHFHSGEGANSVVQGFTITNGYVRDHGGGLYCFMASPRIIDCIVTRNAARRGGGGIACVYSNSIIANCVISGNIASFAPWDWSGSQSGSGGGIAIVGHDSNGGPMLNNCMINGNRASEHGAGISCEGNPVFANCTICENRTGNYGKGGGIAPGGSEWDKGTMLNCIVWGNAAWLGEQIAFTQIGHVVGSMYLEISYSVVEDGPNSILVTGPRPPDREYIVGEWISSDPLFARPGYWQPYEPNYGPPGMIDYFWIQGNYHLKSQAGRWDPETQSWVKDDVTSPCIDAGDPNSPIGYEPFPNGGRINMGAYGGTSEASKSYFGDPLCETIIAGDLNGDCKVDLRDLTILASRWLTEN